MKQWGYKTHIFIEIEEYVANISKRSIFTLRIYSAYWLYHYEIYQVNKSCFCIYYTQNITLALRTVNFYCRRFFCSSTVSLVVDQPTFVRLRSTPGSSQSQATSTGNRNKNYLYFTRDVGISQMVMYLCVITDSYEYSSLLAKIVWLVWKQNNYRDLLRCAKKRPITMNKNYYANMPFHD